MRAALCAIIILITLSGCEKIPEDVYDGPCEAFEYSDTYKYPIVPGTDEWIEHENRREACQIPEGVLATISTGGLLESMLNHPYFMDFTLYDSKQLGFEHLMYWSPGIAVLLNRPDFFSVIFDRYQKMDLDCEAFYPPWYSESLTYAFPSIEIFLAQDEVIDKLDSTQIHHLFETVRELNILKVDKRPLFFMGVLESTALMGKILLEVNYSPFVNFHNSNERVSRFVEYIENNWFISQYHDTINVYAEGYYTLLHQLP